MLGSQQLADATDIDWKAAFKDFKTWATPERLAACLRSARPEHFRRYLWIFTREFPLLEGRYWLWHPNMVRRVWSLVRRFEACIHAQPNFGLAVVVDQRPWRMPLELGEPTHQIVDVSEPKERFWYLPKCELKRAVEAPGADDESLADAKQIYLRQGQSLEGGWPFAGKVACECSATEVMQTTEGEWVWREIRTDSDYRSPALVGRMDRQDVATCLVGLGLVDGRVLRDESLSVEIPESAYKTVDAIVIPPWWPKSVPPPTLYGCREIARFLDDMDAMEREAEAGTLGDWLASRCPVSSGWSPEAKALAAKHVGSEGTALQLQFTCKEMPGVSPAAALREIADELAAERSSRGAKSALGNLQGVAPPTPRIPNRHAAPAAADPESDSKPATTASSLEARKQIVSWEEAAEAIRRTPTKKFLSQLKSLCKLESAPIRTKQGTSRIFADFEAFVAWWNGLSEREEAKEEAERNRRTLSEEGDGYAYGRTGVVVPEVGGVKRRRGKPGRKGEPA